MFSEQMSSSLVAAVADPSKVGATGSAAMENPIAFSLFPRGSDGAVVQISGGSHVGGTRLASLKTGSVRKAGEYVH